VADVKADNVLVMVRGMAEEISRATTILGMVKPTRLDLHAGVNALCSRTHRELGALAQEDVKLPRHRPPKLEAGGAGDGVHGASCSARILPADIRSGQCHGFLPRVAIAMTTP
jgi:hypothetical protein